MNIAILSGKGGTGKTTLSTNLSAVWKANYIDCDVEEPDGFLFLNPIELKKQDVFSVVPSFDEQKCQLCGRCVEVCQFNALAKVKNKVILFEKLCHSCHACDIACDYDAITFVPRRIGFVEEGMHGELVCRRGVLNIGELMAVPVIKTLLHDLPEGNNILDCSPGTSCNVVSTLQYVDKAILVTEPTAFGLHDLKMAVKLVRMLKIPFKVIINKYMPERDMTEIYCKEENIDILGRIPYSREAAHAYSKGLMLSDLDEYRPVFEQIINELGSESTWSW